MAVTKLYEAQAAVFQRLEADIDLNSRVSGVFDYVPEETAFPYVVLGRVLSTPLKTKTTIGENVEITLDIWSDYKGKKETIDIANIMKNALSNELTVAGAFLLSQDITSVEVLEEVNDLYHGIIICEIKLDLE